MLHANVYLFKILTECLFFGHVQFLLDDGTYLVTMKKGIKGFGFRLDAILSGTDGE